MKKLRYVGEFIFVYVLFILFKTIGIEASSYMGGLLARKIGPFLKVNKTARQNITLAFPHMSEKNIDITINNMWDNLGRTVAELPHLSKYTGERFKHHIDVYGQEHLQNAIDRGKSVIIVSGHFGNWEIGPRSVAELTYPMVCVYRKANNPYVNKLIQEYRSTSCKAMVSKGKNAIKPLLEELKNNGIVGMLVDQKMNNGIAVPFFGRDAMTAPAVAELATKFNSTIIPAHVIRTKGTHYELHFEPAMDVDEKTPLETLTKIHTMFESWIKENPSQWFWVHKRWPKQ